MPKVSKKSKFKTYLDKLDANSKRVGIVTEGDSWFAFPLPSRPNVVEVLIKRFGNRAAWLRSEVMGMKPGS